MLLEKSGSLNNFNELQPLAQLNFGDPTGQADSPQFVGAKHRSLLKGAAGNFNGKKIDFRIYYPPLTII